MPLIVDGLYLSTVQQDIPVPVQFQFRALSSAAVRGCFGQLEAPLPTSGRLPSASWPCPTGLEALYLQMKHYMQPVFYPNFSWPKNGHSIQPSLVKLRILTWRLNALRGWESGILEGNRPRLVTLSHACCRCCPAGDWDTTALHWQSWWPHWLRMTWTTGLDFVQEHQVDQKTDIQCSLPWWNWRSFPSRKHQEDNQGGWWVQAESISVLPAWGHP